MAIAREIVIERERRAWELRCQGWTHARIAGALGVDPSTITKLLGRLSARYAQRHLAEVDAVKGAQIAQLEDIADEALQAWRRSIGQVTITTTKTVRPLPPDPEAAESDQILADALAGTETTVRTEDHAGNPAYLSEARNALGDIRKIVGANAPTKLTDAAGDPLELIKIYVGVDLDRV